MKTRRATAVVITLVTFIAGVALAHEGAHGIIAKRMTAMKNISREMKAIGEMLVGRVVFDSAAIQRHAKILHDNCHKLESMFPPGSIDHHSHAKPEIWQQPENFKKEMQRLHEATEQLAASAAAGDKQKLLVSFRDVDGTCKSCHETFRAPEEQ